jgi:hypothetical protein
MKQGGVPLRKDLTLVLCDPSEIRLKCSVQGIAAGHGIDEELTGALNVAISRPPSGSQVFQ